MENNMNGMGQKHGATCDCPGCMWSHMTTHSMVYHMFKKLFILVVIVFAFWLGTKLGEYQGLVHQLRSAQYMQMQSQNASANGLGQ